MRPIASILLCLTAVAARAADQPAVVPEAERGTAAAQAFAGPTENTGIAGIAKLAAVELGDEFPELKGRVLRARVITLDPGAVVGVHEHRQRPGFAYILEGEVVERRNDGDGAPVTRKPGDVAVERTGVVHWWKNETDQPAKALIVDIVPE